jgi:hypothetical protein
LEQRFRFGAAFTGGSFHNSPWKESPPALDGPGYASQLGAQCL